MEPSLPHCLVLFSFGAFPLVLMLIVSAIIGMVNPTDGTQEKRLFPYGLSFLFKDYGLWIHFLTFL